MQERLVGLAPSDARALWRAELRALLALGVPIASSQIAQVAISTTSVILLGWLGTDALAAGGLATNVYFAPFMFCNGLAVAAAPLVSQAVGRRDEAAVRIIVHQALCVSAVVGLLLAIILWHIEPILLRMGQDATVTAAAKPYTRALAIGLVPALWFSVLRAVIAALGHPRAVLVVVVCGFIINVGIAYTLMFGALGAPRLGAVGAAVAVSTTNIVMFTALLAYARFGRALRRFRITHHPRVDWPRLKEFVHLGVPIGGTVVLEIGLFSAAVLLMGLIGPTYIAAHQIAVQCASVAFMLPLGLAQASTIRIGYAAGRGDDEGVRRSGWSALGLAAVCMCTTASLLALAPETLTGFFIDVHNPANAPVVGLAISFLHVAALFQLFDGAQAIAAGALRGLKDTRVPMLLAAAGYWGVGFTASVLFGFPLGLGGVGIWLGLALGLASAATLLVRRFHALSSR